MICFFAQEANFRVESANYLAMYIAIYYRENILTLDVKSHSPKLQKSYPCHHAMCNEAIGCFKGLLGRRDRECTLVPACHMINKMADSPYIDFQWFIDVLQLVEFARVFQKT